ncbi:hypothetical protein P5673_002873 [Acropora cervicornis]|uniref:Uncharacterized protein n=1 Tax=Acropora cervicornis TaxID=6130 RepID=A0AAD9R3R0_ACRCE|nr:hypothetical protein P5673_002873 [Acropora cervicornis]
MALCGSMVTNGSKELVLTAPASMVSSAVLNITWLLAMASLRPRLLEHACHAIGHGKISDLLTKELSAIVKLKKTNKLFQCTNGAFIRKEHTCNGITECGDGSDEESCGNGMICAVLN